MPNKPMPDKFINHFSVGHFRDPSELNTQMLSEAPPPHLALSLLGGITKCFAKSLADYEASPLDDHTEVDDIHIGRARAVVNCIYTLLYVATTNPFSHAPSTYDDLHKMFTMMIEGLREEYDYNIANREELERLSKESEGA